MSTLILSNILICGVMKSGTTTLYGFFKEHPDALVSTRKEIHFFDREQNYEKGLNFYTSHFTEYTGKRVIVEATPVYLCFPEVSQRIFKTLPDARLIFIFRNPIERAYSHFWQCYRNGWPWDSIREAIENPHNLFLLSMGRYASMIERYLQVFPYEQLLLLLTDELRCNEADVRKRCYEHARIDPNFEPDLSGKDIRNMATLPRCLRLQRIAYRYLLTGMKAENRYRYDSDGLIVSETIPERINFFHQQKYKAYRLIRRYNTRTATYPPLDKTTRSYLLELLRDDIERFATLTGLDVSSWLSPD